MAHQELQRLVFGLLLFVLVMIGFSAGHQHHGHQHQQHHHHARSEGALGHDAHTYPHANSTSSNHTADSAEEQVKKALLALTQINRARLEKPKFNKHEFKHQSTTPNLAPPLDYQQSNTTVVVQRRQADNSSGTTNVNITGNSYHIPPELAEAARIVAESSPQVPTGDHGEVAASARNKFLQDTRKVTNDTNTPLHLQTPEGRLSVYGQVDGPTGSNTKRQSSTYWMLAMASQGASPLAPSGYKVWRNVKDYGAVGNGVTDDTAAINLAISPGGRCGPNCGSSTVFPAVVYFPAGIYLVSSSLIQYYNTQLLGDPTDVPTLLASSSFVGMGVITSDVYVSDTEECVRNFKIDIRLASPTAYICGIHWQVAQGTSLENIEFYMRYVSDGANNQQGIYMENGSGGFLAELTFVGGAFGAYFGNQQFTSDHLSFLRCQVGVQVHWDWAWTMHDFVFDSCGQGIVIVGGAGGIHSTGQGVGSLVIVDTIFSNTTTGVVTSLYAENSTSFLIQNCGFFNVETAVVDSSQNRVLLTAGLTQAVVIDSWGFGKTNNVSSGVATFSNGGHIPAMIRNPDLLGKQYWFMAQNLLTRRRPTYVTVPASNIMNVRALGAAGDGVTDDTAVLNSILEGAANTSSVAYFPFGIYLVRDTLRIPVGSRIIGQAWSQIMGTGANFEDELHPRPVVQVARPGDAGIVEIQDMMFTVKGATAGAIVVEWNVRQTTQASAGLWDSHIRVGGAKGSGLQSEDCPKLTGTVNPGCKAASLLMHLTPGSTAYIENSWLWTADHDQDKVTQDQIDVYAGRGLLIEADLAWLWGSAVEHCVLYQYQIANAKNIMMAMIQTESPYFQPIPKAPAPFTTGLFSNDPVFTDCAATGSAVGCAFSWAVRIIDSSTVYVLGAGLYSWFSNYDQSCLATESCQKRGFEVEQSGDIWIYNLCTKAIEELISPMGTTPTYASANKNGFLSSILAWLQGSTTIGGQRKFEGYRVWSADSLDSMHLALPSTCTSALTEIIRCDNYTETFMSSGLFGSPGNQSVTDSICDAGCGQSLKAWFDGVRLACDGYTISDALPMLRGGRIWAGYNSTCLKDTTTGMYCNDVISGFTAVSKVENMPTAEICSYCWIQHYAILQNSSYSAYDDFIKSQLSYSYTRCGRANSPTAIPPPAIMLPPPTNFCPTGALYTTSSGETCDSIASAKNISSAALYLGNSAGILDCYNITAGTGLCLPFPCGITHTLGSGETCSSIEQLTFNITGRPLANGDLRRYNAWINEACDNLHIASDSAFGHVLCLGFVNGTLGGDPNPGDTTVPHRSNGYSLIVVSPPVGAVVAPGTTLKCGVWHVAVVGETCTMISYGSGGTIPILLLVNPSLGTTAAGCDAAIVTGKAYCVIPYFAWDVVDSGSDLSSTITVTITPTPTSATQSSSSTTQSSSSITSTSSSTTSRSSSTALTALTPTATPTSSSGPTYYGCYTEGRDAHALDGAAFYDANLMTPSYCQASCSAGGYALWGVEYGQECYCGNSLSAGSIPTFESQCSFPCPGDAAAKCGAGGRLNLYGISAMPPAVTVPGGSNNVPPDAALSYVGCYTEATGGHALTGASVADSTSMTVDACARFCRDSGFAYAGLEYAAECYCGSALQPGSVPVPEADCNMLCSADVSHICGGPSRLSLYQWI